MRVFAGMKGEMRKAGTLGVVSVNVLGEEKNWLTGHPGE
jgi:hypothetical protein